MLFSLSFSTFAQTDLEDLDDNGQSQDLNFTGDVQDFIIPDGSYNSIEFVLRGGDGGRARLGDCESEGGDGATIKTSILIGTGSNQFPVGTPIRFIVGEKGQDYEFDVPVTFANGGGGGGSAVLAYKNGEWVIIAAAGGGGGAYQGAAGFCVASQKGQGGRATNAGGAGAGEYAGNGGGNGHGGDGGGLILNGDLSGGGGGAFSDGKGNASREGKAGYPDGGAGGTFGLNSDGSNGGWGFGGGGGGEEAGGGGGGGGAENNGGGGGSYVHPTYAIDPVITAGGAGGDTEYGDIDYQFKSICSVNWTGTVQYNGYEFIENICRETDRGTIQMLFDYDDGNICAPNLEWTIFQSGGDTENYVYLGDGRWSNVAVGFHLVQVINTDLDVVVASTEIEVRPRNHQPTAKCKNVTISLPTSKQITVPDDFIDDGSTGSSICDESISFSASKTIFKCTDVGQEQVVLTVTGSSGNSKTCTSTVTIVDNSIAFASCVPDGDYDLLGRESASITLVDIDAGSVRSTCTQEVLFYYPSTFTPQGPVTADNVGESRLVGIRIIDETGATLSRCQTTLTIIDSGTPVLNCKEEVTVTLDADGTAILDPTHILDEGSNIPPSWPYRVRDQEGSPISELSCEDGSELEVTLLVNEFTIYEMSCNTILKLKSSAGPVANCNDKTISLGEDGLAGIEIEEIGLGSYSNCSMFQLSEGTLSKTLFSCEDLGANIVTMTISDADGNTSNCEATVTVLDEEAPVARCQNTTIQLDNNGGATLSVADIDNGSSDACGITSFSLDVTTFSCEDVGSKIVKLTAIDAVGNAGSCTTMVLVEDNVAPIAQCASNLISDQRQLNLDGYSNQAFDLLGQSFTAGLTGYLGKVRVLLESVVKKGAIAPMIEIRAGEGVTGTVISSIEAIPISTDQGTPTQWVDVTFSNPAQVTAGSKYTFVMTLNKSGGTKYDIFLMAKRMLGNLYPGGKLFFHNDFSLEDFDIAFETFIDRGITLALDEAGLGNLDINDIDTGSSDACGIAMTDLSKTDFNCADIGEHAVTLNITDVNSNNSYCTTIVNVEDPVAPIALCQDITIQLDNNGEASISTTDIDNGSNDACGIADITLDQTSFNCDQAGNNTVRLTATDNNGNSSICQATVVVVDETTPTLTCPEDMTVNTDPGECGAYVNLPKAAPADNCGIKEFTSRYRLVDAEGNAAGDWSSWVEDHSGFFELGSYEIQWRVTDPSDNVNFCSIQLTLVDEEAPEVICTDVTIDFNGETILPIASSTIFDQATSFDACGSVSFVGQTLDQVSCENIGKTIPVQVIGIDPNGNTSTCIAQVTVSGIPCGFEATDINCENGASASYDPIEESYTLTATDCEGYPDGEYSIVTTELCGDGEVIAKVASLGGDGTAGVIMMENLSPDARFVSSIKDLTPRTRTEYRLATGGGIGYKSKNRSGVKWVRIVREGPKFKTFTSTNGSYWRKSHTIEYETFANCIQVGLIAYSKNANEPVTAVFENVKVIGDSPNTLEQVDGIPVHALQDIEEQEGLTNSDIGLEIAPNPFAEQTQIEFTLPTASDVTLEIYNLHGQRVQSLENAHLDAGIHRYQWDGQSSKGESLPTGIYMLRLRVDKKWITTKVSLINR